MVDESPELLSDLLLFTYVTSKDPPNDSFIDSLDIFMLRKRLDDAAWNSRDAD